MPTENRYVHQGDMLTFLDHEVIAAPCCSNTTPGYWVCADCGERPATNWQRDSHANDHPTHRFAFFCFECNRVEAP